LKANEPDVLIELGECWQHLRQFGKALDFYQQAVGAAESAPERHESLRACPAIEPPSLAAAMGNVELARKQLMAIVAVEPAFKDAGERLDKLGSS